MPIWSVQGYTGNKCIGVFAQLMEFSYDFILSPGGFNRLCFKNIYIYKCTCNNLYLTENYMYVKKKSNSDI